MADCVDGWGAYCSWLASCRLGWLHQWQRERAFGLAEPLAATPPSAPTSEQAIQEQPSGAATLRALSDALRASLAEWFSVGLLQLRRISWEGSSAGLLEKVGGHGQWAGRWVGGGAGGAGGLEIWFA